MKKSIIAIIAVGAACAAAAGLGGCKSCDGDKPVSGYGKLQGLLSKNYSQIVLTVTDKFDEDTSLVSKYTLAYGDSDVTVTYSIEEFSSLSIDSADAQFKTVKNGSAVIKDGVVVQITGDSAELPSTEVISAGGMTFNEEYKRYLRRFPCRDGDNLQGRKRSERGIRLRIHRKIVIFKQFNAKFHNQFRLVP